MKRERIEIRATHSGAWYNKGEKYEVWNYLTFDWGDNNEAYFEVERGNFGIPLKHCEVLPYFDIKEMIGKTFKHHKRESVYEVIAVTNLDTSKERQERHPICVVYKGVDGKVWSRTLSEWEGKFNKVV